MYSFTKIRKYSESDKIFLSGVRQSELEEGIDIVAGSHLPHNLNTKLSILTGERIKVSV